MAQRYENVTFLFADANGTLEESGEVVLRDGQMVIQLDIDESLPTVIKGIARGAHFVGTLQRSPWAHTPNGVYARWTSLGAYWVGVWRQRSEEFVFWFRLNEEDSDSEEAEVEPAESAPPAPRPTAKATGSLKKPPKAVTNPKTKAKGKTKVKGTPKVAAKRSVTKSAKRKPSSKRR